MVGLLAEHEIWFASAGEKGRRLERDAVDLSGFDFVGRQLAQCCLPNARLDGANFSGADLSGAQLWGASMVGATMIGARFTRAELDKLNAPDAVFDRASLRRCSLIKANLRGASFVEADLSKAVFALADLSGADFGGSRMERTSFGGARLVGVRSAGASGTVLNEAVDVGEQRSDEAAAALRASGGDVSFFVPDG
jgi:uncharacterized protein YjbI with pentapeptide repeats